MYQSGQTSLQSMSWLQNHSADRPTFQAKVARGFSSQDYVVFAMQHGLLFLEHRDVASGRQNQVNTGALIGAMLGGAAGAVIGGILASSGEPESTRKESGLETHSDEELFALARSRKRSFVAERDEIESVAIDAPGFLGALLNGRLLGKVIIRDRRLGKLTLNLFDKSSMSVVLDSFPRHYGNRVVVNVRWDHGKHCYVPQRP